MAHKPLKTAIVIIVIFTILDYLLHIVGFTNFPMLVELLPFYFVGKLVLGTLVLWFLLTRTKITNIVYKAIIVAVVLQVRYYFQTPYDTTTQLTMVAVHAALLWISYIIYERIKDKV